VKKIIIRFSILTIQITMKKGKAYFPTGTVDKFTIKFSCLTPRIKITLLKVN